MRGRTTMRTFLLATGYILGLLLAAGGVALLLDARGAAKTDVGAITSGAEMVVGLGALVIGVGLLAAAGAAEYATWKTRRDRD